MRYSVGSRRRKTKRSTPRPSGQSKPIQTHQLRPKEIEQATALSAGKRRVTSAGGVVVREVGDHLEVLLIAIKDGRIWSLPKGQVEAGERYPQTALREVREETGINAEIFAPIGSIRYHFTVKDDGVQTTITKEVHHFLMGYVDGECRPQQEEVDDAAWVLASDALRRLSHQNERDILIKALARWEMSHELWQKMPERILEP